MAVSAHPFQLELGEDKPDAATGVCIDPAESGTTAEDPTPTMRAAVAWRHPPARLAICVGLIVTALLSVLVGWLGVRVIDMRRSEQQQQQFVQVGRQAAVNLTTVDWQHVDTDVQRILDTATGRFFEDFSKRSQPFVEVVKQARSISVGTVTAAGLESVTPNAAQVLVAVSVKTANAGAPEQPPRAWRMRIAVQRVGEQTKVANVDFVS